MIYIIETKKRESMMMRRLFWFIAFSLAIFLGACSPNLETSINDEAMTKKDSGNSENGSAASSLTIPPIDTAAPTIYETATFGLG